MRKIFFQVTFALFFIHQKKIAHRDIKPENILLNDKKVVKLSDFGISKLITKEEQTTRTELLLLSGIHMICSLKKIRINCPR